MASHGKHTAEYFRQRRALQRHQLALAGTPLRGYSDFADTPDFVARGRELAMMEALPALEWPKDIYGNNVSIAQLMADGDFKPAKIGRVNTDHLCACKCGQPHNNAVSRVVTNDGPNGYQRRVVWYRTMTCRNKDMGLVR